ncbi:MAG TPA: hypothetical protein DEQ43_24300, partial [Nocardioides bacterium]|nr:hypothetical protein [Nocardioides sp.]
VIPMISWTVRKPELLRYELEQIHLAFPGFEPLPDAWTNNALALSGSLKFRMDGETKTVRILLRFDDDHPHVPPRVIPLADGAPNESRVSKEEVRWFSARHQMADGSICLFELPGTSGKSRYVSGRDALRRTERWLRSVLRGEFPAGIDIERVAMGEHYQGIGDVLLGPAAWGPLDETGAFFAVNAREAEDLPLYVVSRWAGDGGSTKTEHKLLPWFEQDAPTAGQTWDAILGDPSVSIPAVLAGRYYTLASEPPPVRDVRQLAQLVFPDEADPFERLRRDFAVERLRARAVAIALRLPDRDGEVEWVFFFLRLRERELERRPVSGLSAHGLVLDLSPHDPLEHAKLEILRTHDLRRRTFLLRNGEDLLSSTEDMKFVLAGAGALGSTCADLLAKAGAGALELWDSQLLETGNVVRHVAPLGNVGLPKAFLVSAHVQHRAPHCETTSQLASVLERGGGGPFGRGWPILSTIANDATELALNEHAVRAGATVFYLRALRRGTVGRLIRVRPGQDACLECIARYLEAGEHRLVSVEAAEDEVITHECGNAVLAASAADLTIVAGLAVRTLLHLEEETLDNHWLWATEGVPDHPELTTSFSKSAFRLDPHPECSVCGGPPVTKVVLPPEARARMEQLAGETAPNETGGILVGSREGQTVKILAVSGPGPNAISTPVKFIRDGEFCAEFLKEAAVQHPGADYVGEWHSHPNGDVRPSGRDVASLLDVAEDPNFLTECPVMVILGAPASPDISATAFPVERAPVQLAVTVAPVSDVDGVEERGASDVD